MGSTPTYSRHRRDLAAALIAAARWIRNPVSEDGAKQAFRMIYALLGPDVHRLVASMRANPEVVTLLKERPDLGPTLADVKTLARLPEGSLGRVYHDFMAGDDIFPGYILGGLAYKDGHFDRLVDWDPDAKWLVERLANSHDITHVLGGYGSDFAGEAITISFTLGVNGAPEALALLWAAQWGAVSYAALLPPVGFRAWVAIHVDAVRRGVAVARAQPLVCIPFERELGAPLEDFRRACGVRPHQHTEFTTQDGWLDTRGWNRGWLGRQMASGFGTMDATMADVKRARRLIEDGFPIPTVMGARRENAQRAFSLYETGASRDDVRAALAG
ncbi:MAG: hypothetical protein IPH72_31680 [Sandaracinaceae bacterium]|nr:hypothetical protein [Sandaracinaceae bacterium]